MHAAVVLPGEGNRAPFRVAPQPPEWQQIDTLNVYGDGSMEDLTGTLTSTALSGLNMGAALDFSYLLCSNINDPTTCKHPFNEPGKYPGGISYGSISIDPITRVFVTDGTLSTIEIVNIMLGAGNDHLSIDSTLQPGGDFNPITGAREQLAHHGGITAVHGGGNALLKVDGTFTAAAAPADAVGSVVQLTRDDGLMWTRYGFLVGQQVTLPNGASYTITGFKTVNFTGDTILLGGGPALAGALAGEVAVSDYLVVTGTFTPVGQRHPARRTARRGRASGSPWASRSTSRATASGRSPASRTTRRSTRLTRPRATARSCSSTAARCRPSS